VISRTSTHRYQSSPEDLPRIAQQLGVAHLLETCGEMSLTPARLRLDPS
jgi:TolB-like protein